MKKKTKKETEKPSRIYVKDRSEKEYQRTIEICRSYDGILFVSEFLLDKADALRLADYIKETWE